MSARPYTNTYKRPGRRTFALLNAIGSRAATEAMLDRIEELVAEERRALANANLSSRRHRHDFADA